MKIAIKENEIDKISITSGISQEKLKSFGFSVVEIDDDYADCDYCDFDYFNNQYFFNLNKYNERKSKEMIIKYENMVVDEIRKKYSLNQEIAILRQRDSKFYEYQEYFDYAEQCKLKAKQFFNMV